MRTVSGYFKPTLSRSQSVVGPRHDLGRHHRPSPTVHTGRGDQSTQIRTLLPLRIVLRRRVGRNEYESMSKMSFSPICIANIRITTVYFT